MEADITPDKLRAGPEPGPTPRPLRLSGEADARRTTRTARRDPPRGRRRTAPNRPGRRPPARRRRSDRRAIVASVLAVLALVGCVMAILMLATQPTAARLQREIGALNRRLAADQSQLATLRAAVVHTAARDDVVDGQVSHVARRLAGLQRTVHGLQSAGTAAQQQAIGLRDCVPQLQQELSGLALQTRSVGGRVTSVGLRDPVVLSAPCQTLFSGL